MHTTVCIFETRIATKSKRDRKINEESTYLALVSQIWYAHCDCASAE
jgi:hypothetical protein